MDIGSAGCALAASSRRFTAHGGGPLPDRDWLAVAVIEAGSGLKGRKC